MPSTLSTVPLVLRLYCVSRLLEFWNSCALPERYHLQTTHIITLRTSKFSTNLLYIYSVRFSFKTESQLNV